MNPWLTSFSLAGLFVVLLSSLGLIARSKEALSISMDSLSTIANDELSDEEKEVRLKRNSIALFKLALSLTLRATIAFGFCAALTWGMAQGGLIDLGEVIEVASSGRFLLLALVLGIALVPLIRVLAPVNSGPSEYSSADRTLHRIAFSTTASQVQLADWESRRLRSALDRIDLRRCVFVTGLPRSGTTLTLNCLVQMRGLVSHSYRDMPFVLVPYLWDRYSRLFRKRGHKRERAHGDGMLIDFDSPEALEEITWMPFFASQYDAELIHPWSVDSTSPAFAAFFRDHIRKIVHLRGRGESSPDRYVSKNNMNIARITLLREIFPDASLIVPFREPLQHASSLLEQHLRFLKIHEQDAFAAEYMRGLGHFEFGENLRPVDFDGWYAGRRSASPTQLGFWLEYWTACYRFLLERHAAQVCFFDYGALCSDPELALNRLAKAAQLEAGAVPDSLAASIRQPRARDIDTDEVEGEILAAATEVYASLCARVARGTADPAALPHSPSRQDQPAK